MPPAAHRGGIGPRGSAEPGAPDKRAAGAELVALPTGDDAGRYSRIDGVRRVTHDHVRYPAEVGGPNEDGARVGGADLQRLVVRRAQEVRAGYRAGVTG